VYLVRLEKLSFYYCRSESRSACTYIQHRLRTSIEHIRSQMRFGFLPVASSSISQMNLLQPFARDLFVIQCRTRFRLQPLHFITLTFCPAALALRPQPTTPPSTRSDSCSHTHTPLLAFYQRQLPTASSISQRPSNYNYNGRLNQQLPARSSRQSRK
jgi:hypothetical protein